MCGLGSVECYELFQQASIKGVRSAIAGIHDLINFSLRTPGINIICQKHVVSCIFSIISKWYFMNRVWYNDEDCDRKKDFLH